MGGGEIRQRRVGILGRLLGDEAVAVKASADHHKTSNQVGSPKGGQERGEPTIAVTNQMRRAADDFLEEGDVVLDHRLERHRALDVRRTAVTSPVVAEHLEVLGQCFDGPVVKARIDDRPMHGDDRVPCTPLVVPAMDPAQIDVRRHAGT
jgi:hypothetical protein